MTQSTRWGIAASVAALLFAGCSGAEQNPVSDGQSLNTQVLRRNGKFDAVLPIEAAQVRKQRLPVFNRNQAGIASTALSSPAEPSGQIAIQKDGMAVGSLGTFRLEIDEQLNAEVLFPRSGQTQGDKYLLGIDQFFRPGNVRVSNIERNGDNLDVTVRFSHPFPRPTDLLPPATATKRLDLHVFNVWAGLLIQGTENYFGGTVTTNTSVLKNADSYRQTGGLVTLPGGVTANVFPGKWIADQSPANTDPAQDNYDPADNGWEMTELQDPTGFGVFHQGDTEEVTFSLDTTGSPLSLDFAVLADYQDPRATPTPKNNRLPDATDPTKLRYILPYGAGDLQSVSTSIAGPLSGITLQTASVEIVDLDADAGVNASFPNNANLSEMPFASGIDSIQTSFPTGITASTPVEAGGSGSGLPSSPKIWDFTLSNTGAVADGDYTGLVRVVDEENDSLASEAYVQLDPNLQPLATPLPIQVYQTLDFTVGGGGGACGTVTINLEDAPTDPSYAITDGWTGPLATQHPFNDDKITGVFVDQVSGAPSLLCHGPFTALFGNNRWGAGFMVPVPDGMGGINIQIIQFRNSASTPVIDQPKARPDTNRGYIVADGRIDPAASSASGDISFWAPYPAPFAGGRGWLGHTDQYNRLISPTANATLYGRPFASFVYDARTFMTNFASWAATYPTPMGGVPLIFTDLYGTSATDVDPFPAHDPLTQQGFNVDVATYYGTPLGAGTRDANFRHMMTMSAIRGTAVATFDALPSNTNAWEFWGFLDVDDTVGTPTFQELWGEFIQAPSLNTEEGAGAVMGAGPGSINQLTTTGFDLDRDSASVYVVDSADDTVERYDNVILEGGADTSVSWTYSGQASAAGDLTNPRDICVTKDGHIVVLDGGGPGNTDRLVVLCEDTLEVIGTRNIGNTTDGEITAGAIGITADDSLVSILGDDSAFVLVWDDPTGLGGFGAQGGLYWYTLTDN